MLDELGPTFVKFGQLLSTRPDIVPPDIITELRGLQDDVRRSRSRRSSASIQADLGLPIERLFLEFDEPIAAASIGQVHRAMLPNGRRVAVKVQRPGAPRADRSRPRAPLPGRAVSRRSASARSTSSTRARSSTSSPARSARSSTTGSRRGTPSTFHRDFAGHPHVHVPRVYWSYTRARVLTLEFLDGAQLADLDADEYTLEQRRRLAELITEAWMT